MISEAHPKKMNVATDEVADKTWLDSNRHPSRPVSSKDENIDLTISDLNTLDPELVVMYAISMKRRSKQLSKLISSKEACAADKLEKAPAKQAYLLLQ